MTTDSTGKVIEQVELPDSGAVREQVDKYFTDAAVLIRDSVMSDLDQVAEILGRATAQVQATVNPLLMVLGTQTGATQADADAFWKRRVKEAGARLAALG